MDLKKFISKPSLLLIKEENMYIAKCTQPNVHITT